VCASTLRVPRPLIEERIFSALRHRILTPDNVRYAAARAVQLVCERIAASDPDRDRRRLAALEVELDRAVDLAVRMDGLDAVQRKLEALEAEKREAIARLECAPPLPDFDVLEAAAVDRVQRFRALFDESPSEAHRALRALLAGDRIRGSTRTPNASSASRGR
jgi:hypothetical protein